MRNSVRRTYVLRGVLISLEFILIVLLGRFSGWLIETILPHFVVTNAETTNYMLWYAIGIAIGFTLYALLQFAFAVRTRKTRWLASGFYALATWAVVFIFMEAHAYALRAPQGAAVDHLYWIGATMLAGIVIGHFIGVLWNGFTERNNS